MGSRNNKPGRIVKGTALQPSLKSASGVWTLDEAMQAHRANAWPQPNLFQPVANSLRLDASRNTFLSKAISRSGNQRTWTWSGWFKPSKDSGAQYLFVSTNTNGNPFTYLYFSSSQFIWWDNTGDSIWGQVITTNPVYRDTSAWYHVVLAVDTTQSTAANRAKLYINGVRVTSFAVENYPAQGETTYTNSNASGENIVYISAPPAYVTGYLAEVNFIDGYQLDPSLLGKLDTNNTWVPVAYTGSYGTNGFYLPFTNAATSQTLGYDASLTGTATYDADQDPYRGSVVLHLTGNGPAGGNNNVFADSGPNNLPFTRNGDVTQGSFSPFSFNTDAPYNPAIHGASAYFDGTGDYLSTPASTPVNFGTDNFTMECWFYSQTSSKEQVLMGMWASDGAGIGISLHGGGGANINNVRILSGNGTWTLNTSANNIYSLNTWNHVALVRSGNTWTAYMNGVSATTITYSSAAYYNASIPFTITRAWSGAGAAYDFQGYISNVRVTKGAAIYTAAFTPTNRPFGTLTNNLITFSENFTSAWWASNTSNIEGTAVAPDGTPSATTLVAGTYPAAAGVGSSTVAVTGSIYAKANVGNQLTFRLNRWGSGADYVEAIFNLTTGVITSPTTAGTASGLATSIVNVGNGWWRCVISGTTSTTGGAISFNPNPTNGSIFIWGAQLETGGTATNYTPTPANFSTAPSLLLNFANAAVVDSTGTGNITTVNGATVTSSSKYGSGALTFNGTNDYFQSSWSLSSFLSPGSNNWTLETWVNMTKSLSSAQVIVGYGYESVSTRSFVWYYNGDGTFRLAQSPDGSTNYDAGFGSPQGGFALNTWYHLAIVRNSGAMTMYVNGRAMPNTLTAYTISSISTGYFRIGVESSTYFGGSMDDLRYTKGVARYTSDFTPPARALPEVGGKSFTTVNVNAGVVRSFTTVGTTAWTAPTDVTSVEVLVVAAGGTGAADSGTNVGNGGGGAGGVIYNSAYPVTPGQTYTVIVGAGQVGLFANTQRSGGNSQFGNLVAIGGGGGGYYINNSGATGGSGGGGGATSGGAGGGTAGQGFNGGAGSSNSGGGGGGAGGPATGTNSRDGGPGLQFGISGTPTYYAGGGGGSASSGAQGTGGSGGGGAAGTVGTNGAANTGGGGGAQINGGAKSGDGGSGIVIVRYTTTAVGNSSDATTDNLTDSPTLYGHDYGAGGEVVGNYATLNPLQKITSPTLTNGNLSYSSSTAYAYGIGTIAIPSTGSYIFEVRYNTNTSNNNYNSGGVCTDTFIKNSTGASTGSSNGFYGITDAGPTFGQSFVQNGTRVGSVALPAGTVVQYLINTTTGVLSFTVNGVLQGTTVTLPTGVTLYPVIGEYNCSINVNFGQRAWAYAPPAGYNALTTKNLPRPTGAAANPDQYFNTVLYTGDGASSRTITGVGFQPDFVWLKSRSEARNHTLYDVVRSAGSNKALSSSTTDPEGLGTVAGTSASFGYVSSFDSDGFSVSAGSTNAAYVNVNNETYVAWCWRAGGTAVANTAGTISSQVSANIASGFSIVTYTANGVTGATVGHGLTTAPAMVIFKIRGSNGFNWFTYHQNLTSPAHYLYLNSTNAEATTFNYINSTAPSSSVLTLGAIADTNSNGSSYVAYCWAEVPGFSKFGSYTANGSVDGPFIYCGFKPRFIMIKATSATSQWVMIDTARDTFNSTASRSIFANSSSAEETGNTAEAFDIVSNGFKLRSNGRVNVNTVTHIFMAFAEAPFGNVNGTAR